MFNTAYQYDPRFVSLLPAGPDTRLIRFGSAPHALGAVSVGGVLRAALVALRNVASVRPRYRQVDYRSFRDRLDATLSGKVRRWGRYTYLYDGRNQLVAVTRAGRVEAGGRCQPVSYFLPCAA